MEKFYIAEILVLPRGASGGEGQEERLVAEQKLIRQYLQQRAQTDEAFSRLDWRWYNSELSSFKIDLAREIIKEAQYANLDEEKIRVLVLLNFASAGEAAQNALLKLIEEPPSQTLILLVADQEASLLETIRSRCQNVQLAELQQLDSPTEKGPKQSAVAEPAAFTWPKDLAEALTLVQNYRDRDTARNFIRQCLTETSLSTSQRQALLQADSDLAKNVNVDLALEHCFFSDLKLVE